MTPADTGQIENGLLTFNPCRHAPSDFLSAWFDVIHLLDAESRKEFGRYYAGYLKCFDSYTRNAFDRRLKPLLDRTPPGTRVLDIGSGCGSEGLLLAIRGCEVIGIEINFQRLQTARKRQSLYESVHGETLDCRFQEGSLFDRHLNLGNSGFDVVWMEETFHHVEPRESVGARIAELVRPGGFVVVAETNALNPLIQLQLLHARGLPKVRTFSDRRGREHQYGVERITSARRLARLFEKEGFKTESIHHYRVFPNLGILPRILLKLESNLNFLPRFAFIQYSYVGRRM